MKWLSHLVASFLVAALCTAVITGVLDYTIFSAHYLENKLVQVNAYPKLSVELSRQVAQKSGPNSDPQLASKLQTVITPAELQMKTTSALNQLQAYYKGNGLPPTIDLSDLVPKLQAAGLPVPQDDTLTKPITINGNNQVKGISKVFGMVKADSLIAMVLAIIALLALSWERHRWAALPDVAIVCGVLLGGIAVLFATLPDVVNKYAKINFNSSAFTSVAHDLITAVAHDLGKTFGIIAIIFLAVGIGTRVLVKVKQPKIKSAPVNQAHPKTAANRTS